MKYNEYLNIRDDEKSLRPSSEQQYIRWVVLMYKIKVLTIADIIEDIIFINASPPNAHHVLIAVNHELQPSSVSLRSDTEG